MRKGRLASMVSSVARPASLSEGEPVQVTLDRKEGNAGAMSPTTSTAANRAPTACTHPEPLEWATAAQVNMVTTLPTTGANHPTGWVRERRRATGSVAGFRCDRRPAPERFTWSGREFRQ